jgi:endo-1,4-beta-xylanase
LQGIVTQSHLWIDIEEGAVAKSIKDLAQFGLPIHVSELDVTLRTERRLDLRSRADRLARQTALVTELAESFRALPAAQRFAFTTWGLRDTDSWYRKDAKDDGKDSPLPFDENGLPNPMAGALAAGFRAT